MRFVAFFALLVALLCAMATPGEATTTLTLDDGDQLFCGLHDTPTLINDDGAAQRQKATISHCPLAGDTKIGESVDHSCCLKNGAPRTLVETGGSPFSLSLRSTMSLPRDHCGNCGALNHKEELPSSFILSLDTPPPQF